MKLIEGSLGLSEKVIFILFLTLTQLLVGLVCHRDNTLLRNLMTITMIPILTEP